MSPASTTDVNGLFLTDLPADPSVGDRVVLAGPEGRHAATVRRIGVGEHVLLSDGEGRGVRGPVVATGKDRIEVEVERVITAPEPEVRFTIIHALPKNDRAELAVDLITEAGVDEIVPWQASRSIPKWTGERGEKSRAKWQSVAREAAKQSRRLRVPVVTEALSTKDVAVRISAATAAYVMHEAATTPVLGLKVPFVGEVVIVIGPEGGISPDELAAFEEAGGIPVVMGDTVLRTSTAGVVALSQLKLLSELRAWDPDNPVPFP